MCINIKHKNKKKCILNVLFQNKFLKLTKMYYTFIFEDCKHIIYYKQHLFKPLNIKLNGTVIRMLVGPIY